MNRFPWPRIAVTDTTSAQTTMQSFFMARYYQEIMSVRDVIIVGAGPSGLSAAIAAKRRHLDYAVLEQGVLVNSIYRFPPQMVFFTTPELLEIGGLPFISPYEKPTRAEALRYYRKVVDKYELPISFNETVLSVQREPSDDDQPPSAQIAPRDVFALETRTS